MDFKEFYILSSDDLKSIFEDVEKLAYGKKPRVQTPHPRIDPLTGKHYRYGDQLRQLKAILADQLSKGTQPNKLYVTYTQLSKVGINPMSDWGGGTPTGVYCYPLSYVIKKLQNKGAVEFGSIQPYINVLKLKDSYKNTAGQVVKPKVIQIKHINSLAKNPVEQLSQYLSKVSRYFNNYKSGQMIASMIQFIVSELRNKYSGGIAMGEIDFEEILTGARKFLYKYHNVDEATAPTLLLPRNPSSKNRTSEYAEKLISLARDFWKSLVVAQSREKLPFEDLIKNYAISKDINWDQLNAYLHSSYGTDEIRTDGDVLYKAAKWIASKRTDQRSPRNYGRSLQRLWTDILRDMGITGMSDLGTGSLYSTSEPVQAVFFDTTALERVAMITNLSRPKNLEMDGRPNLDPGMAIWDSSKKSHVPGDPQSNRDRNNITNSDEFKNAKDLKSKATVALKLLINRKKDYLADAISNLLEGDIDSAVRLASNIVPSLIKLIKSYKQLTNKPNLDFPEIKEYLAKIMENRSINVYAGYVVKRCKYLLDVINDNAAPNKIFSKEELRSSISAIQRELNVIYPGEDKIGYNANAFKDKDVKEWPYNRILKMSKDEFIGVLDYQVSKGITSLQQAKETYKRYDWTFDPELNYWKDRGAGHMSSHDWERVPDEEFAIKLGKLRALEMGTSYPDSVIEDYSRQFHNFQTHKKELKSVLDKIPEEYHNDQLLKWPDALEYNLNLAEYKKYLNKMHLVRDTNGQLEQYEYAQHFGIKSIPDNIRKLFVDGSPSTKWRDLKDKIKESDIEEYSKFAAIYAEYSNPGYTNINKKQEVIESALKYLIKQPDIDWDTSFGDLPKSSHYEVFDLQEVLYRFKSRKEYMDYVTFLFQVGSNYASLVKFNNYLNVAEHLPEVAEEAKPKSQDPPF